MILAAFGVLTNLVSIYILSRKELTNTFNQLLTALAVFDILYLLLALVDCFGQCKTNKKCVVVCVTFLYGWEENMKSGLLLAAC